VFRDKSSITLRQVVVGRDSVTGYLIGSGRDRVVFPRDMVVAVETSKGTAGRAFAVVGAVALVGVFAWLLAGAPLGGGPFLE
jgi:hypothetical protein